MSLSEDFTKVVEEIFNQTWKTRKGQKVPDPEDLQLGNDAVQLNGTVLYADLDGLYKPCGFLQTRICS